MIALTQTVQMFANLMLVNYLTHGFNLQQDPSAPPPQDALTALFGNLLSDDGLRGVHVSTHLVAGAIGAFQLVTQLQSLVRGGSAANSSSSAPTPSGI